MTTFRTLEDMVTSTSKRIYTEKKNITMNTTITTTIIMTTFTTLEDMVTENQYADFYKKKKHYYGHDY